MTDSRDASDAAEIARLRNLLGRYACHVGDCEGVTFLSDRRGDGHKEPVISQEEAEEIEGYYEAARQVADFPALTHPMFNFWDRAE
jgi:hypothetical protein